MKNSILLLSSLAVILISCKKKDDDGISNQPTAATEYFPLTKGSYWIYERVNIDTNGVVTPFGGNNIDSVSISGDTVINNLTYSIMEGTDFGTPFQRFYRDSSGYLVEYNGRFPLFTTSSTDEQLGIDTFFVDTDPWFYLEYKMLPPTPNIEVAAGSFSDCLTSVSYLNSLEAGYPYGVRTFPIYYAKGIGKISARSAFYTQPNYFEFRLVRYHIE